MGQLFLFELATHPQPYHSLSLPIPPLPPPALSLSLDLDCAHLRASRATLPLLKQLQQCPQEVVIIMDKVTGFVFNAFSRPLLRPSLGPCQSPHRPFLGPHARLDHHHNRLSCARYLQVVNDVYDDLYGAREGQPGIQVRVFNLGVNSRMRDLDPSHIDQVRTCKCTHDTLLQSLWSLL